LQAYETAGQGATSRSDHDNRIWQRELATSHFKIAVIYSALGAVAKALSELRKARGIIAALLASAPDNPQWNRILPCSMAVSGESATIGPGFDRGRTDIGKRSPLLLSGGAR
jgi:hypothetical protein